MRRFASAALLLLAACGNPAEPEAPDEAEIAEAGRAPDLHPPAEPLSPQPISFVDIEQNEFFGAGCAFVPEAGKGLDPVLYTVGERGLLKLRGRVIVLAADAGSADFPYGTKERYAGGEHFLVLTKSGGEGAVVGEEAVGWSGSLTIRDRWERIVYRSGGRLECGA